MAQVDINGQNLLTKGYTNSEWENFAKSDLLVFMEKNYLEKITVTDGNGRTATLKRDSKGQWKSSITVAETF